MKPYLLLTPGPLTTSETVKETMMTDWCTWDEDYNLHIVEALRKELVGIATRNTEEYTSVLLQGSGTYCVEAVIGAAIGKNDKLLICSNGAYGDRMGNIAEYYHIDYELLAFDETEQVSVDYVDDYLSNNCRCYSCGLRSLRNDYRYPESVEGAGTCSEDAWQETDCGCYEQLWRYPDGC